MEIISYRHKKDANQTPIGTQFGERGERLRSARTRSARPGSAATKPILETHFKKQENFEDPDIFEKPPKIKDQKIYEDSVDAQFSSNVLAYHFMIKEFFQNSDRGTAANIVNVASDWAGDVDLDDLSFTRRKYDNDTAYRQSKALNRMLTKQWSEYFEKDDAMDVDIKNPNKIVGKFGENCKDLFQA